MHRALERQIKKYLPGVKTDSVAWQNFFQSVDEAYRHFDEDRKLMNRSLELSSKEFVEVNERIAQEKAKDEVILQSIGEGLIVVDRQGKITLVNQAFHELTGWQENVIGMELAKVVPVVDKDGKEIPPEKRQSYIAMKQGKKVSATINDHLYFINKRKEKIPAVVTVAPIFLNGEIIGAAALFRDITAETLVDKAKTEFVSLASHQLRTPLSSIGWYTEMLIAGDAGPVNDEQKSYLEEIYHGNHRMVELVNALLNVSRIELGTFMLNPEAINFPETARSVIKELYKYIHEKELVITENFQKDLPLISADAKLTRIIFQNLITNAVKYTPAEGRITLSLSVVLGGQTGHGDPKEKYVLFTVADTGYGIPKAQENKIFTKLFRADNVREKETDGTGLGLYLVKSVAESCGGAVWFESEENKGSTFSIIIPLSGMRAKESGKPLA